MSFLYFQLGLCRLGQACPHRHPEAKAGAAAPRQAVDHTAMGSYGSSGYGSFGSHGHGYGPTGHQLNGFSGYGSNRMFGHGSYGLYGDPAVVTHQTSRFLGNESQ